jgi:NADPH-dependent 2,4-dienoyl-CoA reductase/sulfur reductase-like enzyme
MTEEGRAVMPMSRRHALLGGGLGLAASLGLPRRSRAQNRARVVVIGGGPAGATVARYLAKDGIAVTLVEPKARYVTCFYSNLYLAGWRDLTSLTHDYNRLAAAGIRVVPEHATAIDPAARTVRLAGGDDLAYDRLVVAPGIEVRLDAIEGYDAAATELMPHAWQAGAQTELLRAQLTAMPDGGLFVIAAPPEPYRCPPAPYERASLVASYFKQAKPKAKILILDGKDSFSKQALFEEAWRRHYPGMIDWVPGALGGQVVKVDPAAMTLTTAAGDTLKADVANVIPAQRAGAVARAAGLADETGWCPIVPAGMASKRLPDVHVLGDAAIASAMPKSAFAANSQAKVVAMTIRAELAGTEPFPARYRNTCWTSLAPEDTVKIGANYLPGDAKLEAADGFVSKVGESDEVRRQTRAEADAWYASITADIFG